MIKSEEFPEIKTGLEIESLRLNQNGSLSRLQHPFSSDHRIFATDFSESQLEIITPPLVSLGKLHRLQNSFINIAENRIGDERLWPFSIPPQIDRTAYIPIANLGESEQGQKEHLYRLGLAHRYGRRRQIISGVHVNMSADWREVPSTEQRNTLYLSAAQSFLESLDWIILLTGASPFPILDRGLSPTAISKIPPVISFRNGSNGYGNSRSDDFLNINSLKDYIAGVSEGLSRTSGQFRQLVSNGQVLQKTGTVFQSEKEFYSPIRLKQVPEKSETCLQALTNRGIGYLELRFLDKDPFAEGGVSLQTLRLLKLIFLKSLIETRNGQLPVHKSVGDTANMLQRGRSAGDALLNELSTGHTLVLRAQRGLKELQPIAAELDNREKSRNYQDTLRHYSRLCQNTDQLPANRIYRLWQQSRQNWTDFGMTFTTQTEKGDHHDYAVTLESA